MMRDRYHRVKLLRNMVAVAPFAWQYDVGQILVPESDDLPVAYEVHFSNEEFHGTAKKQLGTAEGCMIPDEYLESGNPVYMWIYIPSEDHGETEYKIRMDVKGKSKATDQQPTPSEQSIIDETIAALNDGVTRAEAAAESAEDEAEAAEDAADRAEQAANSAGYVDFYIDEDGHLIYTKTDAVDVDFALVNGHLVMEV